MKAYQIRIDLTGSDPYNPAFINGMLKFIKYKKTEWDKLNDSN